MNDLDTDSTSNNSKQLASCYDSLLPLKFLQLLFIDNSGVVSVKNLQCVP